MLDVSVYDGSYFDGKLHATMHNAGYSYYRRWTYDDTEIFAERAAGFVNHLALSGKKVLEVGCAKGFMVEALADAGVDAYGIDVSDYCINTCDVAGTDQAATIRRPDLASRFYLGDVRTDLAQFANNEFDWLYSTRFLECVPVADLPALVTELNRISRNQVHVVGLYPDPNVGAGQYYVGKTQQEWVDDLAWDRGTRIMVDYNPQNAAVK